MYTWVRARTLTTPSPSTSRTTHSWILFFSVIGQGLLLIGHSQCYQMGLADKENLTTAPHALLLQLWCPSKRNMKMSQGKRRGTGTTGKQHNPYTDDILPISFLVRREPEEGNAARVVYGVRSRAYSLLCTLRSTGPWHQSRKAGADESYGPLLIRDFEDIGASNAASYSYQ